MTLLKNKKKRGRSDEHSVMSEYRRLVANPTVDMNLHGGENWENTRNYRRLVKKLKKQGKI